MAWQNFFATRLATDIGAGDAVITLETAPSKTSGRLVLEARNPTQREIIEYTGLSGTQITGVTRGLGGTSAKGHVKNALVEMNLVAEDLEDALNVPNDIVTRFDEMFEDHVVTGLVWSQDSLLVGSMTDGVMYIEGYRVEVPAIAAKSFPASKDIYVDIDVTGTPYYLDVTNGDPAPGITVGRIRLAKVVTNGSTITSVATSGRDSLGNALRPTYLTTIRKVNNPYFFYIHKSNAWTAANGTYGKVTLNAVTSDPMGGFSNTNNRWIAPVPGWYAIYGNAASDVGAGGAFGAEIRRNNVAVLQGNRGVNGNASLSCISSVSGIVRLAQNDYVELFFYGSGGVGISGNVVTFLQGHLISAE